MCDLALLHSSSCRVRTGSIDAVQLRLTHVPAHNRPFSTFRASTGASWASRRTARARLSLLVFVQLSPFGESKADLAALCAHQVDGELRCVLDFLASEGAPFGRLMTCIFSSLIYSNMAAVQLKRQNWARGAFYALKACCAFTKKQSAD